MGEKMGKVKKQREFPHTLIIISTIILIAALLTYIVPAGEYNRVEDPETGRVLVDPDSYHRTEQNPASIMDVFTAIPKGFLSTAWICFLILIVGGAFSVVTSTGAIQAFLNSAITKAKGKDIYFIPVLIFLFSIIPTFIGTLEAYLAFVPLGVLLARSMGLDALVGISIVVAGGGAGLASGIFNPFTVGLAQGLVGLPIYSAAWFRVIAFVGFNLSVSFWTVRYAKSIRKDPKNSIVYEVEQAAVASSKEQELPELNFRSIAILLTVLVAMGFVVRTSLTGGDFKTVVPAIFLMMMVVVAVIAQYSPNQLMELFTKGAAGMVGGILVVGFAKAIGTIMEDAGMIDTIVHALSGMLTGSSKVVGALTMYMIQYITNFFVISGAGQAALTIPILSPIGDIIGVTQQTVVAAFQYGDGITNLLLPMSPLTSGAIAIAGITYPDYFKFIWKIILTNTVIGAICVAFAAIINLGPF